MSGTANYGNVILVWILKCRRHPASRYEYNIAIKIFEEQNSVEKKK